jgi:hypothetical protein
MIKGNIIYYKTDKVIDIKQLSDDEFLLDNEIKSKHEIIMLQNDGIVKYDGFTLCPYCGAVDSYVTDKTYDMCYCDECKLMV